MLQKNDMNSADYTQFWQDNLQKLEEISDAIEVLFKELEVEYANFSSAFDRLVKEVAALVSIQSNFNNIEGREYYLKLGAVISEYHNRYITEGLDFNMLHFLLRRINTHRNKSFELFPWLRHNDEEDSTIQEHEVFYNPEQSPFKWVGFQSNSSWFLAPFKKLEIIPYESSADYSLGDNEEFSVKISDKAYRGRYIFSSFAGGINTPSYFLLINDGEYVFAADKNGKRIYAQNNFITKSLTAFSAPVNNPLIGGRVRLFGINHLYVTI